MQVGKKYSIDELKKAGLLKIGENTIIDDDVWLCHYERNGKILPVKIGSNCVIRSGAVIYSNVNIGNNVNFGHKVVVREGCVIGNFSSIGTGVAIECYTRIGNYVSIETQSHITGWMTIEDYVFVGAMVVSTNDKGMNWKRKGHGKNLKGPTLKYGCRIGSGAILLPGVIIGRHTVVNVAETVRKDIPDNTLMFTEQGKVVHKKIKPEKISLTE